MLGKSVLTTGTDFRAILNIATHPKNIIRNNRNSLVRQIRLLISLMYFFNSKDLLYKNVHFNIPRVYNIVWQKCTINTRINVHSYLPLSKRSVCAINQEIT